MRKLFGKEYKIHVVESTTSTNDTIKDMIADDKVSILIAKKQERGRGKHDRCWISTEGNLHMSIGFISNYERLSRLVFLVAISIGEALKEYNLTYKWPNDLFLDGKKVGGILIESDSGKIIIGIGINVEKAPIDASTCLNNYIKCSLLPSRIIKSLAEHENYVSDFEYIKKNWEDRAMFLNQEIEFNNNNKVVSGKFLGINFDGSLILKMKDGSIKSYYSGSICSI